MTGSSSLFQAVNAHLVGVLGERLERMGQTDSGLYNFYGTRLADRELFPKQERVLMARIAESYDRSWVVHDIGAGIGTLALGLAIEGYVSYAIERDRRRVAAMQAAIDSLRQPFPEIAARFHGIHAKFPSPQVSAAFVPGRTLGVVTNFVATLTEQDQTDFLATFVQYPAAVMDVTRFCVRRDTEPEWMELVGRLETISGRPWNLLADGDKSGKFFSKLVS